SSVSAVLFDLVRQCEVRRLAGGTAAAFSADGRLAVTVDGTQVVRLWEVETGKELRRFEGHLGLVMSVAFSADGRLVATGSFDGTTRLWEVETGRELLRLVSFKGGDWVVVTSEGRFDTNNLDGLRDIHWTLADDPFATLPLEIFMRDYYEPRLLSRVVAGERFAPLRPLAELNRVRPRVEIKSIEQQAGSPELVTVTVEVAPVAAEARRGGREARVESGVYDLRLFRDGQLVAQSPGGASPSASSADGALATEDAASELRAWREATRVKVEGGASRLIKFENVRLPRLRDAKRVEFTAYAFNEERIKSETARAAFDVPQPLAPSRRRAYIISIGVNEYDNPAFRDLRFAANDARLIQKVVGERLARTGEYEVVSVALLSEGGAGEGGASGGDVRDGGGATKENLKAVLDALAGRADAAALARVPGGESLRRAAPEDLLLVSFSGHGYAGARGRFYLVPENTSPDGDAHEADEVLSRLVSSDELSLWLRDVDAGQMLLIIDACHSAASVEGEGFKPGPMGSRGLGQLAYDKGMRILAASQADDVALESDRLEQGLLTFALVREGLGEVRADFRPRPDGQITAGEWLQFAERRVPRLYEQVVAGLPVAKDVTTVVGSNGVGAKDVTSGASAVALGRGPKAYQRPALFDFAARRADVVLARK
ncbi:MAG TPA: hypothetical protein VFX96_12815, partial [Pyrinomonadaceae bacterium]|nr:hypothetical protein [Pyrinomonadaceae bacterium]